jgi:hypothetical protein
VPVTVPPKSYDSRAQSRWPWASPAPAEGVTSNETRHNMTKTTKLTQSDLTQFTGTETWFRHGINRDVLFTEGVKYLADEGGAYWLLDAIAIAQFHENAVAGEAFQVWKLIINADRTASVTCDDGNNNIVYTQRIEYTDFPLDEIKLYFTDNVILLPSEY